MGVFHSHAALLGDGIDGAVEAARPSASLGAEALVAVSEYRAAGAALGWLEERGLSRERIFLFTGSKTLARCEEEPLGVWRAFRRPVEGEALKEVLGAVARFGDLSAEWWRPGCPERPKELVVLAGEVAEEISARARVWTPATFSSRSAKILRSHVGSSQKNFCTRTRRRTGAPHHGRSARVRV